MPFTTKPWNGSAGRWPDAASYCRASMVDNNPAGAEKTKSACHFPYKEPNGDINVNALRAIVGGRGAQADFPGAQAARARARRLLTQYQNTQRSEDDMADVQALYRIAPSEAVMYREENGERIIEGMVVPYEEWSEVDSVLEGHFLERFRSGSLKKTFTESIRRVKGFFEHGRSRMFDSTPVMEIRETWETPRGPFARAALLDGLPEWMIDGVRRGLYGFSLGGRPVRVERNRTPKPSSYNPAGIEERTYVEVRAFDISLTPRPHYDGTGVALRSISDELAIEKLVQDPERLLHLLRETQEAAPTHSEPTDETEAPPAPEEPEVVEEDEPEEKPDEPEEPEPSEPEGSRVTQPPTKDYLSDTEEEEWLL